MFAADMETPNAEGVMGPLCVHLPAPAYPLFGRTTFPDVHRL